MNKLVLWDFDGVIVSSWEHSFEVMRMHSPDITEEEYRARHEGNMHFDPDMIKATVDEGFDFGTHYSERMPSFTLVPGVEEALKVFEPKYTSVIVSSASGESITTFLNERGLSDYFTDIYGYETDPSKIVKIGMALEKHETDVDNTVFITDTLGDIKEAEAHNMKTIGVTWGFHSRETLEKGKPDVILDDPQKLVETVDNLII